MTGSPRSHPPIGVGLWGLGRWDKEHDASTRTTIRRALEVGVPWFDTAEVYGNGRSEQLLGDVLAESRPLGGDVFVSTKVSWEHLAPSQVRSSIVGSLNRLGRPAADLYLVHAPDPHRPITETMAAMEALWAEGKVRAIGVSNFSVEELEAARAATSKATIAVNQIRFNLFDREEADPVADYCRDHGIVVEAYTPLGRGLLAGRYLDGGKVPAEVRRFAHPIFSDDRFPTVVEQARSLRTLAAKEKVPMASIALHWLARRGAAPIVGASRPEQVDALGEAWSVHPPDDLLDRADELTRGSA